MTHQLCQTKEQRESGVIKGKEDLLPRLVASSRILATLCKLEMPDAAAGLTQSADLSALWGVSECARYCILTKLRTPLGRGTPKDTFTTIEKAILDCNRSALAETTAPTPKRSPKQMRHSTYLWPQNDSRWLLVQFMYQLERQLYNAFESCMYQASVHRYSLFLATFPFT